MATTLRKLAGFMVLLLLIYAVQWLHGNPLPVKDVKENVTLGSITFDVNTSRLSSIMDNWTFIGAGKREYSNRDVSVSITLGMSAIKTADGEDVLVDGRLDVNVKARKNSVEVTRVLVRMLAGDNVSLGDLAPDDYTGYLMFRATEGSYIVKAPWCSRNPNVEDCMEAVLQRHNWGGEVSFELWPDFDVGSTSKDYSGEVTFHITLEYLVRKGYLTAEKKTVNLEIPVKLAFHGREVRP